MQNPILLKCKFKVKKVYIRRSITFSLYITWLAITIIAAHHYLCCTQLPNGFTEFYGILSGAVTIMITFYYKGTDKEVEAD